MREQIIKKMGVLVFAALSYVFLAFAHEEVHRSIFYSYGIDSRVEFILNKPPYFFTFPNNTNARKMREAEYDNMNLLHGLNEIIFLPIAGALMLIVLYKLVLDFNS